MTRIHSIGFALVKTDQDDEYQPMEDLFDTITLIVKELLPEEVARRFGVLEDDELDKDGIFRRLTKYRNRKDVKQILTQVYSRAVGPEVDSLKHYKELQPQLINDMIKKTCIKKDSLFIDLGCGVGNVVLQVAAQTGCTSIGIETADNPSALSMKHLAEFKARANYYGLEYGDIVIRKGDFLNDMDTLKDIEQADVLLANNFMFSPMLNQQLLNLFLNCKNGAKIISLKSFVSSNKRINGRTANAVESILTNVEEHYYKSGSVSWTNNQGVYYVATISREPLKIFWDSFSNNNNGNGTRRSRRQRN
nr:2221_t:CDS:2 [Entrophospora candida]